jgi:DNA-damage-inducible protein J
MEAKIMGKTSSVRARIEPELKGKAEHIFQQLGLTTTQAITLFYRQVELKKGLPFDVAIPNEITRKTFSDTDAGRDLIICNDTEDMFKKLGI